MIRLFLIILIHVVSQIHLHSQFINLQIRVEPELSATVEQDLNFGQLVINSGITEIRLGDVNMGIFNIRAYYTQNIYVSLDFPTALIHDNPAIKDVIPMDLDVAYNNTGSRSVFNSTELEGNEGFLPVTENVLVTQRNQEIWQELLLFVYGSIDVGNVNEGLYSGEILLFVDYD